MDGYTAIKMRKSVRHYLMEPAGSETIEKITNLFSSIQPLAQTPTLRMEILAYGQYRQAFRHVSVQAPHYAVMFSTPETGYLENAGYVGELFVLALTSLGLGTCWLGSAQPVAPTAIGGVYCISIAFGQMAFGGTFRSSVNDFHRKKLSDYILYGSENKNIRLLELIQAARLAPSSMNGQPIRYWVEGADIHIFRKRPVWQRAAGSALQRIDAGIALAHLVCAGTSLRAQITFAKKTLSPKVKMMDYMTTASVRFLTEEEDETVCP